LRRFVLERAISILQTIDCGPESYDLFLELYSLEGEWKTSNEETLNMFNLFEDMINFEFKNKAIEDEDSIKKYVSECEKIAAIGKKLEEPYIADNALESLYELYFYHLKDITKALEYAKQISHD
jgi:hypothetical protein